jgi:hypothetical protein
MLKCPFCHFDNEDGALFCEQCKSDLAGAVAAPVAHAEAIPVEAIPTAAPIVAEAIAEPLPGQPYEAIPLAADETIPLATAEPLPAFPLEEPTLPAEAYPVAEAQPVAPTPAAPVAPTPAATPAAAPAAAPAPAAPAAAAPAPAPAAAAPAAPASPTLPAGGIPAPAVAPSAPAAPAPAAPAAAPAALPANAQPRLLVLRGQKRNVEYPVYEGLNFIGRADEKPVDIDLEDQEPPDRIWCSRQHACLSFENNELALEDLNSANGTYVNRTRIYPGQKRQLVPNDIIQIGNVQLKVVV